MNGSIVTQQRTEAERQPFLFRDLPADVMERLEKREELGHWTGERLALRKPEVYAIVMRMIAADLPVESIAHLCKVSENTVRGIREREPRSIEDLKKGLVGKLVIAKERLIERVIQEAPTMEGRDAAVALGIVSDKLALETGAPTARLEITDSRGADEYRRWMESIIDVTPGTGFVAAAPAQTRDGTEAVAGQAGAIQPEGNDKGADRSSDGPRREIVDDTARDTAGGSER